MVSGSDSVRPTAGREAAAAATPRARVTTSPLPSAGHDPRARTRARTRARALATCNTRCRTTAPRLHSHCTRYLLQYFIQLLVRYYIIIRLSSFFIVVYDA